MTDSEDVTKYRCIVDSLGKYHFYFNGKRINIRKIVRSMRNQLKCERQPISELAHSTKVVTYLTVLPLDLIELLLYYIKGFTLLSMSNNLEHLLCSNFAKPYRLLDDKFWELKTLSDFKSFEQREFEFYNNRHVTRENFIPFEHFTRPSCYIRSFDELEQMRYNAITSLNDYNGFLYEFWAKELSWKDIYILFTYSKNMSICICQDLLGDIMQNHYLKNEPIIINILLKIASERMDVFAGLDNPELLKYVWNEYPQYRPVLISSALLSHPENLSQFTKNNPEITISVESLAKIFSQLEINKHISLYRYLDKIKITL